MLGTFAPSTPTLPSRNVVSATRHSGVRYGCRHPQLVFRIFLLADVVDRRLVDLSFEEAFVVVPGLMLLRPWAEDSSGSSPFSAWMCLQREVETLDRRRAFDGQLFADALLVFEALDFVTTGAAVLLDQLAAFAPSGSHRP